MGNVVVAGAIIQCSHKGLVKLAGGDGRLQIAGAAALTSGMEAGLSFKSDASGVVAPCLFPFLPAPNPGSSPCTGTIAATAGVSKQLTIGGLGVLLDTASGQAINPNDPAATWSIAEAGQAIFNVDR
jgi:hypothetical protein